MLIADDADLCKSCTLKDICHKVYLPPHDHLHLPPFALCHCPDGPGCTLVNFWTIPYFSFCFSGIWKSNHIPPWANKERGRCWARLALFQISEEDFFAFMKCKFKVSSSSSLAWTQSKWSTSGLRSRLPSSSISYQINSLQLSGQSTGRSSILTNALWCLSK